MKIHLPEKLPDRPAYGSIGAPLWTDPYIAKQMLKAHLDPHHDAASRKPETIAAIIAWLLNQTALGAGARALDLGCGPGLYCTLLARSGMKVTGVDFSANSLAWARQQAAAQGLEIEYLCQNYLDFAIEHSFDLVTLIYFDFGVFFQEQQHQVLDRVSRLLNPGGWFAFDVQSSKMKRQETESREFEEGPCFWRPCPHAVASQTFHYPAEMAWLEQYLVATEEGVTVYRNWHHYFTPTIITDLLAEHGLRVEKITADLTGKALSSDSPALGVLARKI